MLAILDFRLYILLNAALVLGRILGTFWMLLRFRVDFKFNFCWANVVNIVGLKAIFLISFCFPNPVNATLAFG